jgi:thiamine monophosphate synthase
VNFIPAFKNARRYLKAAHGRPGFVPLGGYFRPATLLPPSCDCLSAECLQWIKELFTVPVIALGGSLPILVFASYNLVFRP